MNLNRRDGLKRKKGKRKLGLSNDKLTDAVSCIICIQKAIIKVLEKHGYTTEDKIMEEAVRSLPKNIVKGWDKKYGSK